MPWEDTADRVAEDSRRNRHPGEIKIMFYGTLMNNEVIDP